VVSYRDALEVRAENQVDLCLIYCYLGTKNVAVINFMNSVDISPVLARESDRNDFNTRSAEV
jgi:hypothetical protein